MEEDGAIAVADFDEQGRGHARYAENRRITDVGLEVFVERNFHTLLAGFDVISFGDTGTPVMVAVIADEVGDGRACDGGGEEIRGVGSEIRSVEAAPGMAHDADFLSVDDAHLDDALRGSRNAIEDGNARIARLEKNVRLENEVAVAVHGGHVVIVALGRRAVAVQAVGKLFVHVNDHGIFLGGVVARGIEERALQAFVVAVFVLDELFAAPGVIALEGICLGDRFRTLQVWAGDEGVG